MSNSHLSTDTKVCSTCKIEKPIDSFSKKAKCKDGLNCQCKQCASTSFRRYYEANHDRQLERVAEYRKTHPADKDVARLQGIEYRNKNKAEISERRKRKYASDERLREMNKTRSSRWYEKNKARQAKYNRVRYLANTKEIKSRIREYEKKNAGKVRVWARIKANKRRARLLASPEQFSASDIARLMSLQKGRCANCRVPLKDGYHIDHKIPVAKGGDNGRHNIELLCPTCNLKKAAKLPHEFAHENGRLL